jgi:hypothetical protein
MRGTQVLGHGKYPYCVGPSELLQLSKLPRSFSSRVSRSCMDCTVLGPPQLSKFSVHARKLVFEQNENLRNPVPLICDDFCAF